MSLKMLFTGHRDKTLPEENLKSILRLSDDYIWVQGGAIGFDTQVKKFAEKYGKTCETYPPNYSLYGRSAPLVRNRQMVDMCSVVVACYDGRTTGGTYYTLKYAHRQGKKVIVINPDLAVQDILKLVWFPDK